MDMETLLIRCPVCGKPPKILRDYAYEFSGYGAWCIIQCKPLIGKPHLQIEVGKASWERAYNEAVNTWNKAAIVKSCTKKG